jgi:hypothetical protein
MIKEKHYITIDDGSEDGVDFEKTRYPYYDDNLDLVAYTSELRDKDCKFFAFVDFSADDYKGKVRFCPHCEEYGIHNKLGPKIKRKVNLERRTMINSYRVMNVVIHLVSMKHISKAR